MDESWVIVLKNDLQKKKTGYLKKEIIDAAKFVISVFLIVAIGYVVFNYVPFIAKYDHYVIATDSMEPVINVGDVVIIDTGIKAEDLEVNQIIAFYADIRGDGRQVVVVHYLDSISEVDGIRTYRTRPEISDDIDPWKLDDSDIVGIKVATIPKIGPILLFAQSTVGRIVLIADVILMYVLISAYFPAKPKKKSANEGNNEQLTKEE